MPRLRLPEVSAGLGGTAHVKEAEGSTARKVILSECGWCVDALLFLLFFFSSLFFLIYFFSPSLSPRYPSSFLKKKSFNVYLFVFILCARVPAARRQPCPGAGGG